MKETNNEKMVNSVEVQTDDAVDNTEPSELKGEIWSWFRERYAVSNYGRIRSFTMCTVYKNGVKATYQDRIMKLSLSRKGYQRIRIHTISGKQTISVHRLVAKAFLSDYSEELQVNHKDLNKTNNNVDNLEMITNIENIRHAFKNGAFKDRIGEVIGTSKYTKEDVILIKKALKTIKRKANGYAVMGELQKVAKALGYPVSFITDINGNKTWKHVNI